MMIPGATVTACRIAVPRVLYAGGVGSDEGEPVAKVRLSFQTDDTAEFGRDWYSLSVDEAREVVAWLTAAIAAPSTSEADEATSAVVLQLYPSLGDLERGRRALYGARLAQADECEEVGIVVDVATPPGGRISQIRLTFVDDVVAYWLPTHRAEEIANGLLAAVDHLRNEPPVVIRDLDLGTFGGAATDAAPRFVAVEVEGAIGEPEWPRVVVHISESSPPVCGDSWWFLNEEATTLSRLLLAAASAAKRHQTGEVGELVDQCAPESVPQPWVVVGVDVGPRLGDENGLWVWIRFDDPLVREKGEDGYLWLRPDVACGLGESVSQAIAMARSHPPLLVEQWGEEAIAELNWG
jgi:hypothetical protein